MPAGTCDPATRGSAHNETQIEIPAPDGSGSVLLDVHYGWDGASVRPDCDGPVLYIKTRNTSGMTAWGLLPNKKKGSPWVQVDPHTDLPAVTSPGALNNLGLSNYSDVAGIDITYTQPV